MDGRVRFSCHKGIEEHPQGGEPGDDGRRRSGTGYAQEGGDEDSWSATLTRARRSAVFDASRGRRSISMTHLDSQHHARQKQVQGPTPPRAPPSRRFSISIPSSLLFLYRSSSGANRTLVAPDVTPAAAVETEHSEWVRRQRALLGPDVSFPPASPPPLQLAKASAAGDFSEEEAAAAATASLRRFSMGTRTTGVRSCRPSLPGTVADRGAAAASDAAGAPPMRFCSINGSAGRMAAGPRRQSLLGEDGIADERTSMDSSASR